MSTTNMQLSTDTILNGNLFAYRIQKVLGQGSFGITYLANIEMKGTLESLGSNIQVAVKEFFIKGVNGRNGDMVTNSAQNAHMLGYKEKFHNEARNLARLSHPNIVKILDAFDANETAYYVMEYIDGMSLDTAISIHGNLSENQSLSIITQICSAVSFMHENKMLHLDIKPSNIMLRRNGDAVLIDFGLSKQYNENGMPEVSTNVGNGTPGYAPIEQANYHEGKDFPITMDVYALGGTLFKMLTGTRPPEASVIFNDGFPSEELKQHAVSDTIISVIKQAMDPRKKQRIQEVSIFTDMIKEKNSDIYEDKYYTKFIGEAEYGTLEKIKVPVMDSLPMPHSVYIKLMPNDNKGLGYEIWLSLEGSNVSIYNNGRCFVSERINSENILPDIKKYIFDNGLLSKKHWENEESTAPIDDDLGYEVVIRLYFNKDMTERGTFVQQDDYQFTRVVKHAHPDWHTLLLNAVYGLLQIPSLRRILDEKQQPFL